MLCFHRRVEADNTASCCLAKHFILGNLLLHLAELEEHRNAFPILRDHLLGFFPSNVRLLLLHVLKDGVFSAAVKQSEVNNLREVTEALTNRLRCSRVSEFRKYLAGGQRVEVTLTEETL